MVVPKERKQDVDLTRMYTVKEMASLLNVTPTYVRDLIRQGNIEAGKPFGGQWRIAGPEVQHQVDRVDRGEKVGAPVVDDDVDEIVVSVESAARVFETPLEDAEAGPEPTGEDSGTGGLFRHLDGDN